MADKGKPGAKQQYFWTKFLDKRAAAKANRRESSIPKAPMSNEDKRNLIICAAIVIAIPIVFVILTTISNKPPPKVPGDPPTAESSK
jgi:hypothetical protein